MAGLFQMAMLFISTLTLYSHPSHQATHTHTDTDMDTRMQAHSLSVIVRWGSYKHANS